MAAIANSRTAAARVAGFAAATGKRHKSGMADNRASPTPGGLSTQARLLVTEAAGAALFLLAAGSFALFVPWHRHFSPGACAVLVVAYLVALRVRFPVGNSWTAPTELAFMPMLFMLPLPVVPLLVGACGLLSSLVRRGSGRLHPAAGLCALLGDSFYALGPAIVLAAAGSPDPGWDRWPILLAAFGAQVVCDAASGATRAWFADRTPPAAETQMLWLYASDAWLACIGVVIATAATLRGGLGLFSLCVFPLLGLLDLAARDRREMMRTRIHLTEAQTVAGMGSAESDHNGQHVLWSGEIRRLHNLPSTSEPSIDAILRGLSSEDAERLTSARSDCLQTGASAELEYTVLANQLGGERIVRMHLCRLQDPTKGMLATYQDVTDRVRRGRAEAASRAKSEFLSQMSHELRTPLNMILGFGQLLEHDNLTDRQRQNAHRIVDAGRHLLDQIDGILDISRVEAGKFTISPAAISARTLLSDLMPTAEVLTEQHGLQLIGKIGADDPFVIADPVRMRQALTNLISNAVKYNRPGGTVTLTLDCPGDGSVRLSIADEGPGIADDLLPRLFVAFDRLGAERSKIEGTGLGLAVTKAIVEAVNGKLELTTEVGRGSTFTIELPQIPAPLDDQHSHREPGDLPTIELEHQRTVLLIEDNAANTALIESILGAIPHVDLLVARDGTSGIEMAAEHLPDAVLLDLMLPDLPGETVLRQLRANRETAAIPVIVVTADVRPGRAAEIRNAGAHAFLTKPIDLPELIGALDQALSAATLTAETDNIPTGTRSSHG